MAPAIHPLGWREKLAYLLVGPLSVRFMRVESRSVWGLRIANSKAASLLC